MNNKRLTNSEILFIKVHHQERESPRHGLREDICDTYAYIKCMWMEHGFKK